MTVIEDKEIRYCQNVIFVLLLPKTTVSSHETEKAFLPITGAQNGCSITAERLHPVNYIKRHHIFTGTVAFEADLDEYISIPVNSYVVFNQIHLNIGNG